MSIKKIQQNKIKTLAELVDICKSLKVKGDKIVFTNGCFDMVHSGHIHTLCEAKNLGNVLIVALNSDNSIKRLKGAKRPIQNQNERALILASFSFVDYVLIFEEDTPFVPIKTLVPNVLVKGGDYTISGIVGADVVLENDGVVEMIPFLKGYSTTSTIAKILDA